MPSDAMAINPFLIAVAALGLNLPQCILAQGTTFVSNRNQTPVGSAAIGSDI
jgi:hypothetical protein